MVFIIHQDRTVLYDKKELDLVNLKKEDEKLQAKKKNGDVLEFLDVCGWKAKTQDDNITPTLSPTP